MNEENCPCFDRPCPASCPLDGPSLSSQLSEETVLHNEKEKWKADRKTARREDIERKYGLPPFFTLDLPIGMSLDDWANQELSATPDETNPKDLIGQHKPPLHLNPPVGSLHQAQALSNGASKYGKFNWRSKKVQACIYIDAAMRHLAAYADGETNSRDTDPPVHHLGHVMACCAILLDAESLGNLVDDRPLPGRAADVIETMTRKAS